MSLKSIFTASHLHFWVGQLSALDSAWPEPRATERAFFRPRGKFGAQNLQAAPITYGGGAVPISLFSVNFIYALQHLLPFRGCSDCLKTGPHLRIVTNKFKTIQTKSLVAPLVCGWSAPLSFVYIAIGLQLVCATIRPLCTLPFGLCILSWCLPAFLLFFGLNAVLRFCRFVAALTAWNLVI